MTERVVVTGASGLLGSSVALSLYQNNVEVLGIKRHSTADFPFPTLMLDLTRFVEAREGVRSFQPTAIVHAAALSKVLECEQRPDHAHIENVSVTENLLRVAEEVRSYFIFISTDQVFGGVEGDFKESDSPAPTHVYGKTKFAAEQLVLQSNIETLIARSNNIVGRNAGWGQSFTDSLIEKLLSNRPVELFADQFRSPIHLRTITEALCRCIHMRASGVLHLGGPEKLSRYETGLKLAEAYGTSVALLRSAATASHPQAHTLHRDGSFDTTKFQHMFPDLGRRSIFEDFHIDHDLAFHN